MDKSGFCLNCFLSPTTLGLKLMGVDIMHTCQIDFTQNKLYKAYQCSIIICTWIAVIWSIYVSLIDKNICIEYCGGFLYEVTDSETSIKLYKFLIIGTISAFTICVTAIFFSKKVKIQCRQENYEGEIAYLTKIRNRINLVICLVSCIQTVIIGLIETMTVDKALLPKNDVRRIACQVVHQLMVLWLLITLYNVAGIVIIGVVFIRCRFKNISLCFKNCKKTPDSMKEVLHVEEFKHSELCEILEKFDHVYGNILTVIILCSMLSEACCLYYAIFGLSYERFIFMGLGLIISTVTISECLLAAEMQDYAIQPIHELYIFSLYPLKIEELIKVITFMKRINGNDFGLHYFGTILYSKKFALEMVNSVWSYLSTLRQFRAVTEENYSSRICNKTINILDRIV